VRQRRLFTRTVTVAAAVGLGALALGGPALGAKSNRLALPGSAPSWVRSTGSVGSATSSTRLSYRVYLAPRGGLDALKQTALAVSTRGSASYRQFLTPAQFRARYMPSAATVASVRAWLASGGARVTRVESHRRYLVATSTVAAAEQLFGTSLKLYRHAGKVQRAPAANLSLPASMNGKVMGVTGLESVPAHVSPALTGPPLGFQNARPCSLFYGQVKATYKADFATPLPQFNGKTRVYAPCGYVPDQFRAAYEGDTDLTGQGESVGIVDAYAAKTILSDADRYSSLHGDPALGSNYSQLLPDAFTHSALCGPRGWAGEETLDVEAVHGMAPDAGIVFSAAASCLNSDIEDALARLVDQDTVSVISNSYGTPEEAETSGDVAAEESILLQAAIEGISVTFSSGDNGDEVLHTGIKQADYPASDPYATGVGGTSTAIGPSGALSWETGWGTHKYVLSSNGTSWLPYATPSYLYGAGGGFSSLFNRPAYQDCALTSGSRGVPDVAMDADPTTGMLIGETQIFPDGVHYGEFRIGGTSLASPLFAGMVALAIQNGGQVGLLNPTIYSQACNAQGTFTDVLPVHTGDGNVRVDYANGVDASNGLLYSIRTFNQDSSLRTTPGWDDVTGLGSPNNAFLTSFAP